MPADPAAVAKFLYALAEGTCLRILRHLAAGPASTTALAAALGLKVVNVSHHLVNLRDAGVVEGERDGRLVLYRLVGAEVTSDRLVIRRPGVTFEMSLATPAVKKKAKRK